MNCTLTAYIVGPTEGWIIEPASPRRDWMDQTPGRGAYRCLPLAMANQSGWIIRNPATFHATWDGGNQPGSTKIVYPSGEVAAPRSVQSHFGSGIITFRLPWLFRTSPGYGLLVRGPTNTQHDSAAPLDGLVETDWAPYTFTMNWKITRRNVQAWFRQGDPICLLMPYPLNLLESVEPRFAPLAEDPKLAEEYAAFYASRTQNLGKTAQTGQVVWQKHYFKGEKVDGTEWESHRSNLKLKPFK
jgi:hypothetical protein